MTDGLQEIRNQLNILEKRLEALEGDGLKIGDGYYYIDSKGDLVNSMWMEDEVDTMRDTIGNVFKTSEEAKFKYGKLKALRELSRFTRQFEPLSENWCIYINEHGGIDYYCEDESQYLYGDYYFNSKEEAIRAVEQIGEDRIHEYLFN